MRDIKYKCYDKESKKIRDVVEIVFDDYGKKKLVWLKGYDIIEQKEIHIKREKNFELLEYTGLHDKNGKEIYEGDIVKIDNDVASMFNIKSTGKVEYNNGLFLVRNEDKIGILSSLFVLADIEYCLRGEVIGNIYDNPELLEKGKGE